MSGWHPERLVTTIGRDTSASYAGSGSASRVEEGNMFIRSEWHRLLLATIPVVMSIPGSASGRITFILSLCTDILTVDITER